jgi:hypothetical protein
LQRISTRKAGQTMPGHCSTPVMLKGFPPPWSGRDRGPAAMSGYSSASLFRQESPGKWVPP